MKKPIQIYLVGGAVRDELLGLPIKERDYVVVGATPEIMRAQGFRQVGRDFPVFLHPVTHAEYALARTERKTGKGYKGFVCHADPSVTLEEDLQRRDLTINAIAKTATGKLVDPYGGIADLKHKILRHVSPSFSEDPVRILRVARFAARFGEFKVHASTNKLMQQMLVAGEVAALVPERVWQELERALSENYPARFFAVLEKCKVLPELFPELLTHKITIRKVLNQAVKQQLDSKIRFAALFGNSTIAEVKALCKRYRVPNDYRELALLLVKYLAAFKAATKLDAEELLNFFMGTDALRRSERFQELLLACSLYAKNAATIKSYLNAAYQRIMQVNVAKIVAEVPKTKLQAAIKTARLQALKHG